MLSVGKPSATVQFSAHIREFTLGRGLTRAVTGKAVSSKAQLNEHQRIHTGEAMCVPWLWESFQLQVFLTGTSENSREWKTLSLSPVWERLPAQVAVVTSPTNSHCWESLVLCVCVCCAIVLSYVPTEGHHHTEVEGNIASDGLGKFSTTDGPSVSFCAETWNGFECTKSFKHKSDFSRPRDSYLTLFLQILWSCGRLSHKVKFFSMLGFVLIFFNLFFVDRFFFWGHQLTKNDIETSSYESLANSLDLFLISSYNLD